MKKQKSEKTFMQNTKAFKLYKELDEEFCKGHPGEGVNSICQTHDELIAYAMIKHCENEQEKNSKMLNDAAYKDECNKLEIKELKTASESLWRLLDDIDTASDMFKPSETNGIKSYKNFYEYVMKKQTERWNFLTNDEKDQNKLVVNPKLCVGKNV